MPFVHFLYKNDLKSASRVGHIKKDRHPRLALFIKKHANVKKPAPKSLKILEKCMNYEFCTLESEEFGRGCLLLLKLHGIAEICRKNHR